MTGAVNASAAANKRQGRKEKENFMFLGVPASRFVILFVG